MRDLTTGTPAKLIFLFTIPLLVGNIFQQFYNMVDMIIVGKRSVKRHWQQSARQEVSHF